MVFQALALARTAVSRLDVLHRLHWGEEAQDTFEYVLIIGGVVVAVVVAITTPIGSSIINNVVAATCLGVKQVLSNMVCAS